MKHGQDLRAAVQEERREEEEKEEEEEDESTWGCDLNLNVCVRQCGDVGFIIVYFVF